MIEALLLAAAEPAMTAIDAERAFAADAQKSGQWTAFRKWATDDAIMFVPQAGSAHEFLKGKADPPVAVFWWPGRSYVSCDGSTAINSGPWVRGWGKSIGYFTTVWRRQADGSWKWLLDHGDALAEARAEGGDIKPRLASCARPVKAPTPKLGLTQGGSSGGGQSKDASLVWRWFVRPDGSRTFEALLWNGKGWDTVINDSVKAE
ncbi:MAG TPA: hypothetical protein VFO32_04435 [Sphingomicrobium sp.]|jgi:hypothetical protein|nr:hypothetical protein [Sphingomicrobium sp.]